MKAEHILYPPVDPYSQHSLQVDHLHSLHIEECGNPLGIPVLFIHGGPGGGYSSTHRRFFDPDVYRIILFDQRGCGRSRPHACLTNNTTAHLIEDIEKIRRHLKIDQWMLFGGSWGSTLSLLYAQAYPERVLALTLRGIFLCREQDTEWFYQKGADRFFPEFWKDFIRPIPKAQRGQLIQAYYEQLTSENEIERMRAAEAWSVWEGRTSSLSTDKNMVDAFSQPHHALAMARIECHYFIHHAFIEDNQILNHCDAIRSIPTTIIHGRYDMVCPVNQAFELAEALPEAKLIINDMAGHSALEKANLSALVQTMNNYRDEIS